MTPLVARSNRGRGLHHKTVQPADRQGASSHIELKRQRGLLAQQSMLDRLTGVPKRRYFQEKLEQEWRRAMRHGHILAVAMIDIDFFKKVNDRYGHAAGDACLKQVAALMSETARRPGEFVARYGGEEFTLLMPQTNLETACGLIEIIRAKIEADKIDYPPHLFSVTANFGVSAMIPNRISEPALLLETADRMLYEAKESGRNCARSQETSVP